jgi:uncharacterized membrane protein YgdD (TMEM256/DUF423 family)
MNERRLAFLGALCAGVAVALGAFGAHNLHDRLVEAGQLENWHTAVRYQVWHGLALVLLGTWRRAGYRVGGAGWAFLVGIPCFSGSLYALALGVPSAWIWPVTPLGGLLLLVGWVTFAAAALRGARDGEPG